MVEERPKLLNYKPVFQKFIEANEALLDCYGKIGEDTMKNMNQSQLDTQCSSERESIRRILNSNEMTFTTVVKDRCAVMRALHKAYPEGVQESTIVTEVAELPKFRN